MSHSVRHQQLFPLAVVCHRVWIADAERRLIGWRTADHTQRGAIAARGEFISRGCMVAEVSDPQLVISRVDVDAGGLFNQGLGTFELADWRHIASGSGIENQNRISHVIGDKQLVAARVESDSGRPIQLRLGTLNNTERSDVAARSSSIDGNRWRQVLAGTWNGIAESQRPIRFVAIPVTPSSRGRHSFRANLMDAAVIGDEYEIVFRIESDSMRVRKQRVVAL